MTDRSDEGDAVLLAAARDGDRAAFGSLVEHYRPQLHAHCYRMLGSLEDADDAVQETLLRAWRGIAAFEGRSSLRTWLLRIATNAALSAGARRPPRMLPLDHRPAAERYTDPEPVTEQPWLGPYPDPGERVEQRETVRLAFVAALQLLPPNERAALLMRDVLGFSAAETADALGTTTAAVNSALQRARRLVDDRAPSADLTEAPTDPDVARLVADYVAAMDAGDVVRVVALLAADATWSMPPLPEWFVGHDAIAGFLVDGPFTVEWRRRVGTANGQPAVAAYQRNDVTGMFDGYALDVLTIRDGRIAGVTAFLDGVDFERFGLPKSLPDEPG